TAAVDGRTGDGEKSSAHQAAWKRSRATIPIASPRQRAPLRTDADFEPIDHFVMAITAPRRVRAYLIHVERVLTFLTFDRFLRLEPRSRGASFLKPKHTPSPPLHRRPPLRPPRGSRSRDMSSSFHGCLWSGSTQAQSGSCKSDNGCSTSGRR